VLGIVGNHSVPEHEPVVFRFRVKSLLPPARKRFHGKAECIADGRAQQPADDAALKTKGFRIG
jgi:hypothetical protein